MSYTSSLSYSYDYGYPRSSGYTYGSYGYGSASVGRRTRRNATGRAKSTTSCNNQTTARSLKPSECVAKIAQCLQRQSQCPTYWIPPYSYGSSPCMNLNVFTAPPHNVLTKLFKECLEANQKSIGTEKCKCVIVNPMDPISSVAINHNKSTNEISLNRMPRDGLTPGSTVFSPQFQNCTFYNIGTDAQDRKTSSEIENDIDEEASLRQSKSIKSYNASRSMSRTGYYGSYGSYVSNLSYQDLESKSRSRPMSKI